MGYSDTSRRTELFHERQERASPVMPKHDSGVLSCVELSCSLKESLSSVARPGTTKIYNNLLKILGSNAFVVFFFKF